jgi:hypothetical protein
VRLNLRDSLERGALWVATYLDARQEQRSRQQFHHAVREQWRVRVGIPMALMPIGDCPKAPLSAVLLGIRIGTCEQRFMAEFDGFPAEVSVSHDGIGDRLRFTARSPEPQIDPMAWPPQTASYRQHLISGRCADRPIRLVDVGITQLGYASDVGNYADGHVASIVLGDGQVTSSQWSAYLLGLKLHGVRWQARLGDVEVSLRPIHPDLPWIGLAARARKIRQNRFWRIMESATFRRLAIPADLPRPVQVDLLFPEAVTAEAAERLLLEEFCWLLDLYAGRRVVLIGPWDAEERCGLLKDFGRPLAGLKTGDLGSGVMIRDYLDAVLPTWETMTEDERRDIRIGIGILRALPVELEAAVVVGGMGLEHLARAFLPPAEDGYELSKSQRAQVRSQLMDFAAAIAPESDWLRDLPLLVGRLFQRPAPDRIRQLCETFGVTVKEGEIKAYAETRNPVTHGRLPEATTDQKIKAMLFERHAIAVCLLRKLGYEGAVYDVREARTFR